MIRVVGAVIRHRGQIFLAQRASGALAGYWEFPGGKLEPGESDRAALRRELLEELNMKVSIGQWLCSNRHTYKGKTIELHLFLATVRNFRFILTEHSAAKWVYPKDLKKYKLAPADRPGLKLLLKFMESGKGRYRQP